MLYCLLIQNFAVATCELFAPVQMVK